MKTFAIIFIIYFICVPGYAQRYYPDQSPQKSRIKKEVADFNHIAKKQGHYTAEQWRDLIDATWGAGESWTPLVENLSAPLYTLHFKDGIGWAAGDNGLVLRTDNFTTWINHTTGEKYPAEYELSQNYPNPFNSISNFEFRILAI